jgi:RHS repeat-associated protein
VYNADNQLKQWGSSSPNYDGNGNLLNDGTNSYSWNSRNQLASMNNGGAAFSYDSFGRRVAKSIAGGATAFLYDGANVVQELQSGTATANLLTGGIDEVFLRMDSSGTWNLLPDALGSTAALADSTGEVQTQYTYDPFGNTTSTGTATGNANEYTGREFDETGLYFYRARYYSPAIGRFITEDPIRSGLNTYVYATNNPTKYVDPFGLANCVYSLALAGVTLRHHG